LFWFGGSTDQAPELVDFLEADADQSVKSNHAYVYRTRLDVTAIASGCGTWGRHLLGTVASLPIIFDDQARHLGQLRESEIEEGVSHEALKSGTNVVLAAGDLMVFGMTGKRLVLNAELFELCATEYTLAKTAGAPIKSPSCFARFVATRRLWADEARAAKRVAVGLLPFAVATS